MKVYIDNRVHEQILSFYEIARSKHITLDEEVITHKMERLYAAIESLGQYAKIYPLARLKKDWIENQYHEMIYEDFHFAYKIHVRQDGSHIVRVYDACHSLLYY